MIGDLINKFESLEDNSVKTFNKLFILSPIITDDNSETVTIGDMVHANTRVITIGDTTFHHVFEPTKNVTQRRWYRSYLKKVWRSL